MLCHLVDLIFLPQLSKQPNLLQAYLLSDVTGLQRAKADPLWVADRPQKGTTCIIYHSVFTLSILQTG